MLRDDDVSKASTGPSPASSAPAQTHTPYPNVLNPVDEPPKNKASPAASASAHDVRQHSKQQPPQRNAFEEVSRPPYLPEPTQYQDPQFAGPAESVHQQAAFANHASDLPLDAYDDLFSASFGYAQAIFPGWIVTSFDEHKWWTGLGPESMSFGVQ